MRLIKRVPLLFFVFCAAGYSNPSEVHEQQLFVFGTLVDISLGNASRQQAEQAFKTIGADFRRLHHDLHAWEPGALTELNAAFARGESRNVGPELLAAITSARTLSRQSGGLFNPAIGKLIALWGFHSSEFDQSALPAAADIQTLIAQQPSMEDIDIAGSRVSSRNPAVQLDFGSFAKGYALDLAVQRLRAAGIPDAIINAGGDLKAIGRRVDRPWRIGIRHPRRQSVLASIETHGEESVFTSGDYIRYFEFKAKRYPHVIDPRTGMPVQHVTSVTVIHRRAAVADAADTALMVSGPEEGFKIARRMGITEVMLVDEAGTVYLSPAMAKRIEFEGDEPERVIIADMQ